MRSNTGDRTTRALIRDAALRLFADVGPDRVSLRRIAAQVGVSHGLVIHHFGSKEGLRAVVDAFVVEVFDDLLQRMSTGSEGDPLSAQASDSLVGALLERLPEGSAVPAYLRRLLLDGSAAGQGLFQRLYALSRTALDVMAQHGYAEPGEDPDVRAAFLLANDLAVLLLREQLTGACGVDPLSPQGARRWGREVTQLYGCGLRPARKAGEER